MLAPSVAYTEFGMFDNCDINKDMDLDDRLDNYSRCFEDKRGKKYIQQGAPQNKFYQICL